MRLTVDHQTRYSYDTPVRSIVQSHRLTPSVFAGQKVVDWEVTVSGGVIGARHRDGAGDVVQGWTIAGPVSEVTVQVRGTVETQDLAGVLRGHRETVAPDCYLRDTLPTRLDVALAALAETASGSDPLALAHALSAAVSEAIAYRPGVTHAHTTAAEALTTTSSHSPRRWMSSIIAARSASRTPPRSTRRRRPGAISWGVPRRRARAAATVLRAAAMSGERQVRLTKLAHGAG